MACTYGYGRLVVRKRFDWVNSRDYPKSIVAIISVVVLLLRDVNAPAYMVTLLQVKLEAGFITHGQAHVLGEGWAEGVQQSYVVNYPRPKKAFLGNILQRCHVRCNGT